MGYVKDYFVRHRELILTIGLLVVVDHYLFRGAFKEKLRGIVHKLLEGAENKLEHGMKA